MANSFAIIDGEYINVYSVENPMLHENDECYFLFTNVDDFHRPCIGFGVVIGDQYLDGLNKQYIIKLQEVSEPDYVMDKFFYNKMFRMSGKSVKDTFTNAKPVMMREENIEEITENNFFRIDAFFVRNSYEKIIQMRTEYMEYIKSDLLRCISDVNEMELNK